MADAVHRKRHIDQDHPYSEKNTPLKLSPTLHNSSAVAIYCIAILVLKFALPLFTINSAIQCTEWKCNLLHSNFGCRLYIYECMYSIYHTVYIYIYIYIYTHTHTHKCTNIHSLHLHLADAFIQGENIVSNQNQQKSNNMQVLGKPNAVHLESFF